LLRFGGGNRIDDVTGVAFAEEAAEVEWCGAVVGCKVVVVVVVADKGMAEELVVDRTIVGIAVGMGVAGVVEMEIVFAGVVVVVAITEMAAYACASVVFRDGLAPRAASR
jgi:hypothetical protein